MSNTFKKWLKNMSKQKKLAIFDFDRTLANTPNKPSSQEERDKMGWNGKDWWGSKASLSDGITFNDEIVKAFQEAKKDPDTYAVFMTGRRGILADRVRELLREKGLIGRRMISSTNEKVLAKAKPHSSEQNDPYLHDEFYSGDWNTEPDYPRTKGKVNDSTIAHKRYIIEKKLMNDNIQELHIWDDRSEHIPIFAKICRALLQEYPNLKKAIIHRVYPPEGSNSQAWVQHIPID